MNTRNRIVILCATIAILLCCAIESSALRPYQKSSPGRSITGKLVADDGQSMDECSVQIYAVGHSATRPVGTVVNSRGEFSFDRVEPGVYGLTTVCRGYISVSGYGSLDELRCTPGDNVTVRTSKGGVITGRVTNLQGEPVTGLFVKTVEVPDTEYKGYSWTGNGNTRTDDRGIYR